MLAKTESECHNIFLSPPLMANTYSSKVIVRDQLSTFQINIADPRVFSLQSCNHQLFFLDQRARNCLYGQDQPFWFHSLSKTVTSHNYSIFFAHMYMSNSWKLPLRLSCWGQAVSRDVHTYKGLQAVLLLLTFIRPDYPVQRFMGPCRPCCYNRTWLLHT